jgi:ribosomal protein S18 acetylase RimI-like enzyme
MEIRLAAVGDAAAIAALAERYWVFESIGGFDRQRIEALLRDLLSAPERGACWVAEGEGRLCGYLLAVFMFSLEHGGLMAEIDELFVSPEMRSAGVGTLLVAAAERDLAGRGLVRLQLQLAADNERARLFYERLGFLPRAYELLDKPLQEGDAGRRPQRI